MPRVAVRRRWLGLVLGVAIVVSRTTQQLSVFVGWTSQHRGRQLNIFGRQSAGRKPNPFDVLKLEPGASEEDIKKSFRRLAKVYHPDVPETGSEEKFQSLLEAASQLAEDGHASRDLWESGDLGNVLSWGATGGSPLGSRGPNPSGSSSAAREPWKPPPKTDRVVVSEVKSKRRSDLRKAHHLKTPLPASPETLETVRSILAKYLDVPDSSVTPDSPLSQIGFFLETNTIGLANVAAAVMAMEEAFNIELLKVLVNTWVKFDMPSNTFFVKDLANLVQGKLPVEDAAEFQEGAVAPQPAAVAQPAPAPAPAPVPSPAAVAAPAVAPVQSPPPAAAAAPQAALRLVVAEYDCVAERADELSFSRGDQIEIIDDSDADWWKGRSRGVEGVFPSNYVSAAR